MEDIGWVVAIEPHHRFRVTADGTPTAVVLSRTDGSTWGATEKIRIDGREFSISFVPNSPTNKTLLTLTDSGDTHTSEASGGGCGYLRFPFGHHKLFPGSPSRGVGPIANLVIVRLDLIEGE